MLAFGRPDIGSQKRAVCATTRCYRGVVRARARAPLLARDLIPPLWFSHFVLSTQHFYASAAFVFALARHPLSRPRLLLQPRETDDGTSFPTVIPHPPPLPPPPVNFQLQTNPFLPSPCNRVTSLDPLISPIRKPLGRGRRFARNFPFTRDTRLCFLDVFSAL